MSKKSWIGGIYLKEEGVMQIILKSLFIIKKDYKRCSRSPD